MDYISRSDALDVVARVEELLTRNRTLHYTRDIMIADMREMLRAIPGKELEADGEALKTALVMDDLQPMLPHGQILMEIQVCGGCGGRVNRHDRFCRHCGRRLILPPPKPQPGKRGRRK